LLIGSHVHIFRDKLRRLGAIFPFQLHILWFRGLFPGEITCCSQPSYNIVVPRFNTAKEAGLENREL
jgi:hypothetical protein